MNNAYAINPSNREKEKKYKSVKSRIHRIQKLIEVTQRSVSSSCFEESETDAAHVARRGHRNRLLSKRHTANGHRPHNLIGHRPVLGCKFQRGIHVGHGQILNYV